MTRPISDKSEKFPLLDRPRWTYRYHRTCVLDGVGLTPQHCNRVCQCVMSLAGLPTKAGQFCLTMPRMRKQQMLVDIEQRLEGEAPG